MLDQIIDLRGHILKFESKFRLLIDYPLFKGYYIYTRNRLNNNKFNQSTFTLIILKRKGHKRYYYLKYIPHLKLYILRDLKFIRYEKRYDIKYEWEYRKKRNSKVTKT